jgi:phenylpyruvate tautomerase PptA (4-oxalocrotonate tautomerase family)
MPHIRITAQKGTFNTATQNKFVGEVTDAVLASENANPKDPAAQSLAWAYFNEQPKGSVYVGKQIIDKPPVLIQVSTPQGALDQAGRAALEESIYEIVNDFVGTYENRLNHWLLMDEITEGSWASAGIVFSLDDVKTAMNIPK